MKIYNPNGKFKIAAYDFGMKFNQIRLLCKLNASVHVLPWSETQVNLNGSNPSIIHKRCNLDMIISLFVSLKTSMVSF